MRGWLLVQDKDRDLSRYRISLAEETLANAKMGLENQFYRDSINRSYYAAFYAIKAVLATESIDFKRHKDAVGYFNKTYVATEKFPRELGKRLGRLKMIREESDYSDFFIASKEDAMKQYETAKMIIDAVKSFLEETMR
jgi:uncharacterized protein (UPF0332 family)